MSDGTEAIADDEILYRRIPFPYFNPEEDAHPTPMAFRPRASDATGLSLYRAKYRTMVQVAENVRGKRYWVAALRAGELREHGIDVAPRPTPTDPWHAEIPGLTYESRRTPRAKEQQLLLAERLCVRIEGPFPEAKGNA